MTLYLSRVKLARNPATIALQALIDPRASTKAGPEPDPNKGRIMDAHHRLIWALFAGDPDRRRDFLWRSEGKGQFYILSPEPPAADGAGLFDPPKVKDFAPDLRAGDRLAFVLRVNATRTVKTGRVNKKGNPHHAHIDVVMERLRFVETEDRADVRQNLAQAAARDWMAGQGARNGFVVAERSAEPGPEPDLDVQDYSVAPLPSHVGTRKGQPQFGIMELAGHLIVTEPAAFVAKLAQGFGRAKSFGCGLMLIRRA